MDDIKAKYTIKYTGLARGFAWGNCTYFVAQNKTVTWRGNAKQWMKNASAQGIPTGQTPAVGAIIQFSGHGYNKYYGHVGIVVGVNEDTIIVKDMNYRGLNEVTIRKIAKDHPSIDGYIYVD
jgi:surface antigen